MKSVLTIGTILILDLITFTKCRISGAKVKKMILLATWWYVKKLFQLIKSLSDRNARSRQRDEINFVMQVSFIYFFSDLKSFYLDVIEFVFFKKVKFKEFVICGTVYGVW